jgi:hypothetical protein
MKKLALIFLLLLLGTNGFAQNQENVTSELVILNVFTGEERTVLRQN